MAAGYVRRSTVLTKFANTAAGIEFKRGSLNLSLSSNVRFRYEVQTSFFLRDRMDIATAYFVGTNDIMWSSTQSDNKFILSALPSIARLLCLFELPLINPNSRIITVGHQPATHCECLQKSQFIY